MVTILEIDTSTPGGIFQLIIGIICLPVVFYLFSLLFGYIFGGMAKISNRRIVRHGKTIADPDTIDTLNEEVKSKIMVVKKGVAQATDYVKKQMDDKKRKSFVDKLQEIDTLRKKGTITEQEYILLRTEILKKYYS